MTSPRLFFRLSRRRSRLSRILTLAFAGALSMVALMHTSDASLASSVTPRYTHATSFKVNAASLVSCGFLNIQYTGSMSPVAADYSTIAQTIQARTEAALLLEGYPIPAGTVPGNFQVNSALAPTASTVSLNPQLQNIGACPAPLGSPTTVDAVVNGGAPSRLATRTESVMLLNDAQLTWSEAESYIDLIQAFVANDVLIHITDVLESRYTPPSPGASLAFHQSLRGATVCFADAIAQTIAIWTSPNAIPASTASSIKQVQYDAAGAHGGACFANNLIAFDQSITIDDIGYAQSLIAMAVAMFQTTNPVVIGNTSTYTPFEQALHNAFTYAFPGGELWVASYNDLLARLDTVLVQLGQAALNLIILNSGTEGA